MKLISGNGIIKKSPVHGWGVFASKKIDKGEIIEECPYLIFKGRPIGLKDYVFKYGDESMLALGNGSIYNHSDENNTDYYLDEDMGILYYEANRDIEKGEEITIHYGDAYWDTRDAVKQ